MPNKLWHTDDNPPPVTVCDISPKKVDVYDWEWSDARRSYQPAKVGTRDPDAEIQACKGETLREIMARMPGKNVVEKLDSAVSRGIVLMPEDQPTDKVVDLTKIPNNYLDAFNEMQKGAAAYKAIPEEYRKKYDDPVQAYQAYINDLVAKDQSAKKEEVKQDVKE